MMQTVVPAVRLGDFVAQDLPEFEVLAALTQVRPLLQWKKVKEVAGQAASALARGVWTRNRKLTAEAMNEI